MGIVVNIPPVVTGNFVELGGQNVVNLMNFGAKNDVPLQIMQNSNDALIAYSNPPNGFSNDIKMSNPVTKVGGSADNTCIGINPNPATNNIPILNGGVTETLLTGTLYKVCGVGAANNSLLAKPNNWFFAFDGTDYYCIPLYKMQAP